MKEYGVDFEKEPGEEYIPDISELTQEQIERVEKGPNQAIRPTR
jgi:hypothetical protein